MMIVATVGLDVIHCSMNFHTFNRWGAVFRTVTVQNIQLVGITSHKFRIITQINVIHSRQKERRQSNQRRKWLRQKLVFSIFQKNQEMIQKQEQSILALKSGNMSLTNQRLDSLSKDINDLKESLEFPQNEYMMINSRIWVTKFKT